MLNRREYHELSKLSTYQIVGEPLPDANYDKYSIPDDDIRSYGISRPWAKAIQKSEKKLEQILKNLPFDFKFYFLTSPRIRYNITDDGAMLKRNQLERKHKLFKQVPESPKSINVVYTGWGYQKGMGVVPPTPWMILHRMCHGLYVYEFVDHFEVSILRAYYDFMTKVYGDSEKPGIDYKNDGWIEFEIGEKNQSQLFTFKSARDDNISTTHEGLMDLMVQTIINKFRATMVKKLPDPLKGFEVYPLVISEPQAQKARHKFLSHVEKRTKFLLKKSVGRYLLV